MRNLTQQVFFERKIDQIMFIDDIERWTPLKHKTRTANIQGKNYPVVSIYWDGEPGLHDYVVGDDWTFPSPETARKQGCTQPDFLVDILPELEEKFEFKRFEVPRTTERDRAEKKRQLKDIETLGNEGMVDALKYIKFCRSESGSRDRGGIKECIRDAFIPLVSKHPILKGGVVIEKLANELIHATGDNVEEYVKDGIMDGLKSVFAA